MEMEVYGFFIIQKQIGPINISKIYMQYQSLIKNIVFTEIVSDVSLLIEQKTLQATLKYQCLVKQFIKIFGTGIMKWSQLCTDHFRDI